MNRKEVDTDNLVRVKNFAKMANTTTTYLYLLYKRGEIDFVEIDNVKFVDVVRNESFLNKKTRKVTKSINKLLSKIK